MFSWSRNVEEGRWRERRQGRVDQEECDKTQPKPESKDEMISKISGNVIRKERTGGLLCPSFPFRYLHLKSTLRQSAAFFFFFFFRGSTHTSTAEPKWLEWPDWLSENLYKSVICVKQTSSQAQLTLILYNRIKSVSKRVKSEREREMKMIFFFSTMRKQKVCCRWPFSAHLWWCSETYWKYVCMCI